MDDKGLVPKRPRRGIRSIYVWAFAIALMIEAVGQAVDAVFESTVHKVALWLIIAGCLFFLGLTLESYKRVRR